MTDPQTPATEAGRRHVDRWFTHDGQASHEATVEVLAIEAEAGASLDVDVLARALRDSDLMRRYSEYANALPTMTPTPMHTLRIEWAEAIAREYNAILAETER